MTRYKPNVVYMMCRGRSIPKWTEIVRSIEENEDRQKEIANIALRHPEHKIIMLCNRTNQVNGIYDILKGAGEYVEKLVVVNKHGIKNAEYWWLERRREE
jgi:uncharacterized protein YegL